MPRYNVEYNGRCACFSGIVDDFITGFMDRPTYEVWCRLEYSRSKCLPLEKSKRLTIQEAATTLCLNKDRNYVLSRAREIGIPDTIILPALEKYERQKEALQTDE